MIAKRPTSLIFGLVACLTLLASPVLAQPLCDLYDSGETRPGADPNPDPACGGTPTPIPVPAGGEEGWLTTLFASDNQFAGNTFDVEVIGGAPVVITSFDVNLSDPAGPTNTVSVYWRLGTSVGVENDPGSWTLLGTDAAVVSAGQDNPAPVAIGGLEMVPGQVYGFYVDLASYPVSAMRYTNGGPNVYSDANLQVTTNTGQASPAFSGGFFPRQWNGNVHYQIGANDPIITIPTMNSVGLAVLILALGAVAFVVLRRRQ